MCILTSCSLLKIIFFSVLTIIQLHHYLYYYTQYNILFKKCLKSKFYKTNTKKRNNKQIRSCNKFRILGEGNIYEAFISVKVQLRVQKISVENNHQKFIVIGQIIGSGNWFIYVNRIDYIIYSLSKYLIENEHFLIWNWLIIAFGS